MKRINDRFTWAANLCAGRVVLDIGGVGAGVCIEDNPYYRAMSVIRKTPSVYRTADIKPEADIHVDLNSRLAIDELVENAKDYDIVMMMEVIEHTPLGGYLLTRLSELNISMIVTLPANDNWVLNALRWDYDHVCGFTKSTAYRFVERACKNRNYVYTPLIGKYTKMWIPVYLLSGKPISHGFYIP